MFAVSILASVASLTGCSSQQPRVASPDSSDPAWTPPGEMHLTVNGDPTPSSSTSTTSAALPCQPNKQEITGHQIHAANYTAMDPGRPTRKALTN
jgi:hypothetical protein